VDKNVRKIIRGNCDENSDTDDIGDDDCDGDISDYDSDDDVTEDTPAAANEDDNIDATDDIHADDDVTLLMILIQLIFYLFVPYLTILSVSQTVQSRMKM
jgi:hypothetical protein